MELKVCLITVAYFHSVWLCNVRLVISDGSFISVACMCLIFPQGPVVHSHNQGRYTLMSVEHTLCVCSNTVRFGPIRLNILCIDELRECRVRRHWHNCILSYIWSCWSVGPVPCSTGRRFVPEGTVRDFQDTWLINVWTYCGVRLCRLQ